MTEPQDPQSSQPPYPGPPAQPYRPPFPQQTDPNVRPGSVTAAAWIAIALSALGLAGSLALASVTTRAVQYVIDRPADFDLRSSDLPAAGDISATLNAFAFLFIVASIVGIVAAAATLKRQGWARIMLVVMSALTALVAIPFSLAVIGILWLAGSITVMVLLFTGNANAWFRNGVGPRL